MYFFIVFFYILLHYKDIKFYKFVTVFSSFAFYATTKTGKKHIYIRGLFYLETSPK